MSPCHTLKSFFTTRSHSANGILNPSPNGSTAASSFCDPNGVGKRCPPDGMDEKSISIPSSAPSSLNMALPARSPTADTISATAHLPSTMMSVRVRPPSAGNAFLHRHTRPERLSVTVKPPTAGSISTATSPDSSIGAVNCDDATGINTSNSSVPGFFRQAWA